MLQPNPEYGNPIKQTELASDDIGPDPVVFEYLEHIKIQKERRDKLAATVAWLTQRHEAQLTTEVSTDLHLANEPSPLFRAS